MLVLFVLPVVALAQTCSDSGIGSCLAGQCPAGATCITSGSTQFCCLDTNIGTSPATQTCGDSGLGLCVGTLCPAGATCINQGTANQMCCADNMIGVTTAAPTTTAAAPVTTPPPPTTTRPPPTTPPLGCADNTSANCGSMLSYCNVDVYYNVMTVQCPRTCNRCGFPTRPPVLPTTTASSSIQCRDNATVKCSTLSAYCTNAAYVNLLTQQCPVTCNRCSFLTTTQPPVGNCVDLINPNTGTSDCPNIASYCTNTLYYTLMTQQCPRTCNRCPTSSTTCSDSASNCATMASYCTNTAYYDVMTVQCPKTCNRCPTSTGSSSCVDLINANTGTSDCPLMTAYCNNAVYKDLMTQQCPKTCGICSG